MENFFEFISDSPIEVGRYQTLKETLLNLSPVIANGNIIDFGCGYGLSLHVMLELGAKFIVGIEPDLKRVLKGNQIIKKLGIQNACIMHVLDTQNNPIRSASVDVVMVNGVLEHIPHPRKPYIQELWRFVKKGGYLIINESPNKYIPIDFHTTGLVGVNWLPSRIARWYAIRRKKIDFNCDWDTSGWRGIGYLEIKKGISDSFMFIPEYKLIPDRARIRHRILSNMGIVPCLLDPYPLFIFRKMEKKIEKG